MRFLTYGAQAVILPDSFALNALDDHPSRLKDRRRLDALAASGLMNGLPEEAFDRIVRLATRLAGVPVGLFSVVDDLGQTFKAQHGFSGRLADCRQTPLSHSFCQYVVTQNRPLAVSDARDNDLLRDNGAIPDLGVVAYLGVPIHGPRGEVLGSLCAIDSAPHDWSEQQLAVMTDLAAILESEIALRDAAMQRQLLLSELNHRVKNLFAVVQSIVRISKRTHDDAAAMAAEIEQRLNALSTAHQLILPSGEKHGADASSVGLQQLFRALIAPYPGDVSVDGPVVTLGRQATTSLSLAFHEMLTNSAKYGALHDARGRLTIRWDVGTEGLTITWLDEAPPHDAPQADHGGFGSQLIDMTLSGQMQAAIEDISGDDIYGLRIVIPLNTLTT